MLGYDESVGNLRTCTVAFTGYSGTKHTVDVTAESLYEAAVLGIRAISEQWGEIPAPAIGIVVEIRSPAVTHEVCLKQIRQWVDGTAASPKERIAKDRLRV